MRYIGSCFYRLKKKKRRSVIRSYDIVKVTELLKGPTSDSITIYKVLFACLTLCNSYHNDIR